MSTILIVDDDFVFLAALERLLSTAGYHVLRANDGQAAGELLDRKHDEIDLAIVDLLLPDINGFELIGAIARRATNLKVLATTGIYKDAHLEMAGSLGAHAAIRKPAAGQPLPEREWLGAVRQLIGDGSRDEARKASGLSA